MSKTKVLLASILLPLSGWLILGRPSIPAVAGDDRGIDAFLRMKAVTPPSGQGGEDQTAAPAAWFAEESARMNQLDERPEETDRRLRERAAELTAEEIWSLGETALNQKAGVNERILALYLLRLSPQTPSDVYEKIALLKEVEEGGHLPLRLNTTLSLSALEEIQLRSLRHGGEISRLLKIARASPNPKVSAVSTELILASRAGKPFYLEIGK
jgi:hypothetical protein